MPPYLAPTVTLNNGVAMPVLGLGVWAMREGDETENAVRWALDAGYRLIDTAKLYGNERSVGKAVRESGIPREEIFVTTKLWPTDFFNVQAAFDRSLAKLNIGYIDLYLIHWPIPGLPSLRRRVWADMQKLYAAGVVRAIGVSNYTASHIKEVLGSGVASAVNQVRFNPFAYKRDVLQFCKSRNIMVEAYSPLTRARQLHNPAIQRVAEAHRRSPAQILIRWALQHGTVVIPKSSHRERIIANAQVFDFQLTDNEMTSLDALTK